MIIHPADRTGSVKEYYFSVKNKEIAAMNADGTLRLNIRQGMYLVKTKSSTIKAMKK